MEWVLDKSVFDFSFLGKSVLCISLFNCVGFSNDRAEFIKAVQETQAEQQASDITRKRKRLAAAQKRAGELEKLICKIYEDNVLGKLPDARYAALDAQYAKEQESLSGEIAELEKAIAGYEQSRKSAEKFIALVDKYENFDNLTTTMRNEFVEKILVHERDRKGSAETLMPQLMKAAGVTVELKADDQMKWVGLANNCKAQAEEIILHELIYDGI